MKAKARGTLARLEALEAAERERLAAVEDLKTEQWANAALRLSPADRASLHEHLDTLQAGGERWAAICRAAQELHGPPLEDPAGEVTRAWCQALEDTPEGQPSPLPPPGAAAYCEREAARCEAVREEASGEVLPDGVSLAAAQMAACWSAAWWRYEAAYALELGDLVRA